MSDLAIKNEDYKAKVLKENAHNAGCENLADARQYVIECSESDPNFFRWLFQSDDSEAWNDFDLPEQAEQAWEDFVNEYF